MSLKIEGSRQAAVSTRKSFLNVRALALDPFVEVGEGQGFEGPAAFTIRASQPVVVDERVEAVLAAVPDVPDEGPVVEELAVLVKV